MGTTYSISHLATFDNAMELVYFYKQLSRYLELESNYWKAKFENKHIDLLAVMHRELKSEHEKTISMRNKLRRHVQ